MFATSVAKRGTNICVSMSGYIACLQKIEDERFAVGTTLNTLRECDLKLNHANDDGLRANGNLVFSLP